MKSAQGAGQRHSWEERGGVIVKNHRRRAAGWELLGGSCWVGAAGWELLALSARGRTQPALRVLPQSGSGRGREVDEEAGLNPRHKL